MNKPNSTLTIEGVVIPADKTGIVRNKLVELFGPGDSVKKNVTTMMARCDAQDICPRLALKVLELLHVR